MGGKLNQGGGGGGSKAKFHLYFPKLARGFAKLATLLLSSIKAFL